jgi:2-oxoglutarate ferredoxin oxidoreductase subunit beta
MTYIKKPQFKHPGLARNALGLTHRDYEGVVSTLCAGCGHDSVTAAIIEACFELAVPPHRVAKLSGIGCSSKTTNYFLNRSHGFNAVHGRMPSIATGANLANRDLLYVGVSGDGDSASIGLGQLCHAIRRRLDMVYIVENNGTYGLTKGQFSATNDRHSKSRRGAETPFDAIDLATLAIELGAGFVARSFSGDKQQLVPLIKAAMAYNGFALIDVISPCVTFNNHAASTKSYDYVRMHNEAVDRIDFVPDAKAITLNYDEGESVSVNLHDGSRITLRKIADDYDPRDQLAVLGTLRRDRADGKVTTGLLFIDEGGGDLHAAIQTSSRPLNSYAMSELCPGTDKLAEINDQFR